MAEKDLALKLFFSDGGVFADFCNGFFFNGKKEILPSSLISIETTALYYIDGNQIKSLDRDVAKHYINPTSKKILATIGIENQSKSNSHMTKRVMSYDAGNYRKQVDKNVSDGNLVVTVVIDYDQNNEWNPKTLLESLPKTNDKVVQKLASDFASDYKTNFLHIRNMTKDDLEKYGMSDLRLLFEVIYDNIHNDGNHEDLLNFINNNSLKVYYPEILALAIYSLTESEYYKTMFDIATKKIDHKEGEPYIMCDILKVYSENLRKEGKIEGRKEGKIEGRKEGRKEGKIEGKQEACIEFILNLLKLNKSDEEIKQMIPNCTDELIDKAKREFNKDRK